MTHIRWVPRAFRRTRGRGQTGYIFLEGCPKQLGCTLLLRGGERTELVAVKRVATFAVAVAYNLRLEVSYLNDRRAQLPLVSSVSTAAAATAAAAATDSEQGAGHKGGSERQLLSSSLMVDFGSPAGVSKLTILLA
jgi:1-phosphatidylinositol-3-phosphate 5-kinase